MKILIIGDIVAKPGRQIVKQVLPSIIKEKSVDFVLANAENIAHGRGATIDTIKELMDAGVNFFTSGDHIFWQKTFFDEIEKLPVIRPANMSENLPGKGHALVDTGKFGNILIINLAGRVSFGNNMFSDPFSLADEILKEYENEKISYSILDFHADATSEKMALAFYLDGRVNAIVGTHTHIPTCDHRVLPKKSLYVSDIGMTGAIDSVLGVEKEIIIQQYLTGLNQKFEWENTGTKAFRGVLLDTEANSIERYDMVLSD